jgi:glycosyltransferase involved in cell wall biosynthesis
VIGGNSGGVPDAVEHEVTGLLVEPDDSDGVAAAIRRLTGDLRFSDDCVARGAARDPRPVQLGRDCRPCHH